MRTASLIIAARIRYGILSIQRKIIHEASSSAIMEARKSKLTQPRAKLCRSLQVHVNKLVEPF